jgi:hypothetical protein
MKRKRRLVIPDNVFIRCHSFLRNDFFQPHFQAFRYVFYLAQCVHLRAIPFILPNIPTSG